MLVTEALERSIAAVILRAAVRRDGEPDKWPRVCRVDVKSCCVSGGRMGGARIGKGREYQVTIRVEGVVSAGREWPRREWQRALGSDEERRKGDEGE